MGAITKRVDSTGAVKYQAKCRRKGFPVVSKTFNELKDAKAFIRETERAFDLGKLPESVTAAKANMAAGFNTLADILVNYRDHVCPTQRGGGLSVLRLNIWLDMPFSKTLIRDIKPAIFTAYRDMRLKEVSAGTVIREFNLLYAAINRARTDHGVEVPECRIKRPKSPAARTRRLNPGELDLIIKSTERSRSKMLKPAIILAIETGARAGELIKLTWDNVDLKRQIAYLPMTKNGHPRTIPLSSRACEVLSGIPRIGDRVLTGMTSESLKRAWIKCCERAEINGLRFHDLRREFISSAIERGLSIAEIQVCSGHRTLSQLATYSKPSPELIATKLG